MADYDTIVNQLKSGSNGGGVQKASQSERKETGIKTYGSIKPSLDTSHGICAALVIRWLTAKHRNQDFWAHRQDNPDDLLPKDYKFFDESYQDHLELGKAKKDFGKDKAYEDAMKGVASLTRTDSADTCVVDQAASIATTVLTDTGRLFILSLARDGGAHALGLYRAWALFGKKDWAYFYDPNKGELWANKRGLCTILQDYGKYDTAYALRIFT